MSGFFETILEGDQDRSLSPRLQQLHGSCARRRIDELEATVARLRAALESAEEELRQEKSRMPAIGDFVRCPLTNFFGQVTKITPRTHGRPWVEIIPYLAKDLPGHRTMDLYDSWELIDPPGDGQEAFAWPTLTPAAMPTSSRNRAEDDSLASDIEVLLEDLWSDPDRARSSA